jgi:hypothetical protein
VRSRSEGTLLLRRRATTQNVNLYHSGGRPDNCGGSRLARNRRDGHTRRGSGRIVQQPGRGSGGVFTRRGSSRITRKACDETRIARSFHETRILADLTGRGCRGCCPLPPRQTRRGSRGCSHPTRIAEFLRDAGPRGSRARPATRRGSHGVFTRHGFSRISRDADVADAARYRLSKRDADRADAPTQRGSRSSSRDAGPRGSPKACDETRIARIARSFHETRILADRTEFSRGADSRGSHGTRMSRMLPRYRLSKRDADRADRTEFSRDADSRGSHGVSRGADSRGSHGSR